MKVCQTFKQKTEFRKRTFKSVFMKVCQTLKQKTEFRRCSKASAYKVHVYYIRRYL